MILEAEIEQKLRERLENYGFKVLKLVTPGRIGTMDRMILRPRYSPGPPMFVELKRPGIKNIRPLQLAIGEDWKARGCLVLEPILGLADMLERCNEMIEMVIIDYRRTRQQLGQIL
jgi:hypothetical protein